MRMVLSVRQAMLRAKELKDEAREREREAIAATIRTERAMRVSGPSLVDAILHCIKWGFADRARDYTRLAVRGAR